MQRDSKVRKNALVISVKRDYPVSFRMTSTSTGDFQIMKKTLAALAVLGAFAGSAAAADVTLYGVVDYGFLYNYTDKQAANGTSTDENTLKLQSGVDAGSRWGVKGTEDLGNGLKVGFQLESGFNADDGTLSKYGDKQNRLFGRQATLSVYSDFGTLTFGRMGALSAAAGSYDIVYSIADAFDGGDNDVFGLYGASRYDNTVAYQTPKFAGLQVTAMYSFKQDSNAAADKFSGDEGDFSSAKRYAGVALTGEYGPAQFVAAYELTKYGSNAGSTATGVAPTRELDKDANVFFLGGNYDFGVAKVFAMGQYFNGLTTAPTMLADDLVTSDNGTNDGVKGFGFHLGTQVPAAGGLITVGGYYSNFQQDGVKAGQDKLEGDYYGLAARYEYDLSKRTMLYAGAGYGVESRDKVGTEKDDTQNQLVQAYVGLTHRF